MIPDNPYFRHQWHDTLMTVTRISQIYGTSRPAIYQAARRFKYGPRKPQAPAPIPERVLLSSDLTEALLQSGGRYRILAHIADREGLTVRQVEQRYHRARAAEPSARPVAPDQLDLGPAMTAGA